MNALARLVRRPLRPDERGTGLLLTAAASYLGRFGAGLVLLVTIPMVRAALAPELFGVWMMLSSLVAFLGFADLGVGNGVLNRVTRALAAGDAAEARRAIAAGYLCTTAVGLALIAGWTGWIMSGADPLVAVGRVPAADAASVRAALTLWVVLMAINIPATLVQKAQLGAQQGHWTGLAQFVAAACVLVALPLALRLGGGLAALVAASLGVQVMVNVSSSIAWLRRSGFARGLFATGWNQRSQVTGLLRSGSLFFVLQLAVAFAFQSDAIVVTQVLGQRAYGDFAVVQRLFLVVSMIVAAATSGLWPAFGDAIARRDIAWARRALWRGLALAGAFAALGAAAVVLGMGWLAGRWLHAPLAPPLLLTSLLGAWTAVDAMGTICGAFMNAANALRAQAAVAIGMAAAAFAAKWWLVPVFGTPGTVAATLAAYLLVCVPGQVMIVRRVFIALRA